MNEAERTLLRAALGPPWSGASAAARQLTSEFVARTLPGANPLVREDVGRVAIERGPLVYCLEQPDQPGFSLFDASLLVDGTGFVSEFRADLLGGVLVLKHHGSVVDQPFSGEPLYQALRDQIERPGKGVALTFIPYYAWANRGPSKMEVWVPYATVGTE